MIRYRVNSGVKAGRGNGTGVVRPIVLIGRAAPVPPAQTGYASTTTGTIIGLRRSRVAT